VTNWLAKLLDDVFISDLARSPASCWPLIFAFKFQARVSSNGQGATKPTMTRRSASWERHSVEFATLSVGESVATEGVLEPFDIRHRERRVSDMYLSNLRMVKRFGRLGFSTELWQCRR
jgi:hypothetical protein